MDMYISTTVGLGFLPTKGKALPDINWFRSQDRMFFHVWSTGLGMVNSGQAVLRKLAYSEAG